MTLFKRLRFFFRFLAAIFKREYLIIFVGLLLGTLFFVLLPTFFHLLPLPKKTLKIGLFGQFDVNNLPDVVLNDISYGLTTLAESGEPEPKLSSGWTAENEGKKYIFKLKSDELLWHDGKKFYAEDINYNFKDVSFLIGDNQIEFNLKDPFSPFPGILVKPLFKKGLIGLGDYKVKKIVLNGKYVKSIDLSGWKKSSLPTKLYHFYNTEKDLKTGFNLGEVDSISGLFDLSGLFLGKSVKTAEELLLNVYVGLFFNTTKTPFSSKTFRQALAYAIPKEEDVGKRALGPLSPLSWAYNPDVKPYLADLSHAKELLDKEKTAEGWPKIVISTLPQYENVANLVAESWKKIGLETEIKISLFVPEDYDVLIMGREIPKDPDQYYFWHSTQAGNLSFFKSPRIDKLLEDGRKTMDQEERKNIYFDFQRFLVEETPVVFLFHPTVFQVTRN